MSFYVGQKVVCVDDVPHWGKHGVTPWIKHGVVYVVTDVFMAFSDGSPLCHLVGFSFEECMPGRPTGFACERFRPLEELKQEAAERQRKEMPV